MVGGLGDIVDWFLSDEVEVVVVVVDWISRLLDRLRLCAFHSAHRFDRRRSVADSWVMRGEATERLCVAGAGDL